MSSLFGGSTPQVQYTPTGLQNPTGFNVSGGGTVSNSPTLQANIGNLQSTFTQGAGQLGNLAATVAPGFSQFRQAGLADIASAFQSNLSSLNQNLAQRGVAGSSFANSSISNAYANEAQQQANFEANSYLQELSSSFQLTQAQYQMQSQAYSSAINQSNIESQTAANLVATNNQIGAQIATANAQLTAQSQAGLGGFVGSLIGAGSNIASSSILAAGLAA